MRRYKAAILISFVLILGAVLSCSREDAVDPTLPVIGDGVPLRAQMPAPMETKSEIADGTGVLTWTEGDQLAVFAGHPQYGQRYYMAKLPDSEAGKTTSTFKIDYWGERSNFAVYPATYSLDTYSKPSDLRIMIPANYMMETGAPATYPPMVAVNEEGQDLQFRHVCGMLRLTLNQVPVGTQRIKVWLGENIVGTYQVDVSDPDHPFVSIDNQVASGDSQDVTFTLGTKVAAGTRDGIVLNVPLPEGTYYNLGITFYMNLTSNYRNELRIHRGGKRVIKAGHGYHETIDCSGAVKKNIWNVAVPETTVAWGSSQTVNPTVEISSGGNNNNDLTGESGVTLDMDMTCFTEDPSIATAYVQPISSSARPQIVINGITPGETYIRVRLRYGDNYMWSRRAKITVYTNNTSYMPAVSYPRVMVVGDRFSLGASLQGNFEFRTFSWEQLDGFDYASLTPEGLLTAKAPGSFRIRCTVTTNEGSVERYPLTIRVVDHPAGTLKGIFSSGINGEAVFFSTGHLIYYKGSVGQYEYEAYDPLYESENLTGHFEFMSPQYDFYTGRHNQSIISRTFVPAFDIFNYRMPMNHFGDSDSTTPVEVDGTGTIGWHAPTRHQWEFIISSRRCSTVGGVENARFARAMISDLAFRDVPGLVIFPDCYIQPSDVPAPSGINQGDYDFTNNKYTPVEWALMEAEGAVFLPLRGRNTSNTTSSTTLYEGDSMNTDYMQYSNDTMGHYWDNVPVKGEDIGYMGYYYLYKDYIGWTEITKSGHKNWMRCLRLVKDLQ